MNTEEIRRGLRDFRTRAATMNIVMDAGVAAVSDVIPLLNDRSDSVRWSAIKILTGIGDESCCAPLLALMEQGKNAAEAACALREITGRNIGDTAGEWRAALSGTDGAEQDGARRLGNAELLSEAVKGLPVSVTGGGDEFAATVSLPDGRSQQVWIDFSRKDTDGRPIVCLSTPCGKADPERYREMLVLNMSISYGAVAVAALDGELCFAVVNTHLRSTVHPEDIAGSIMSLAGHGDSVEKSLGGRDAY
ncbi:MAG: hypothetical protein FJ224_07975 [Lentisphaerae bacterium]|nr:hypothetical protein [Lentisphaerota bacterium]